MEIYLVKNNYSANSTDTIIEKAERALKTRLKYHPLFNNCEHFCHECCVNSSESLQVNYELEVFWKVALSVYGYFIHNGYHSFLKCTNHPVLTALQVLKDLYKKTPGEL